MRHFAKHQNDELAKLYRKAAIVSLATPINGAPVVAILLDNFLMDDALAQPHLLSPHSMPSAAKSMLAEDIKDGKIKIEELH